MSARTARWFWAVVAAQILFLLAWAGYHEVVRSRAPTILLKARPADPRDLLRGDYMTFAYDIATVALPDDPGPAKGVGSPSSGDLWVVLEKHGAYHEAVRASLGEPALKPGQIAVRARRGYAALRFGIERYYAPEGRGTPKFKTIQVEAALSPAHWLYVKRVLLDGAPYP